MKTLIPYLIFNGNCREAMNFYKQCFDGELELLTFSDSPIDMKDKGTDKNQIMHATLKNKAFSLMASDWPGGTANVGNNMQLNIECETKKEIESLFEALSDKGKIVQPLSDTFWGAHFGMLIDKFGIHWMLNYPLQK